MAKSIAEWIFRLLLLAIAASLMVVYWQKRDNGRYEYHFQPATPEDTGALAIVDTRTGTVYMFLNDQWVEAHPQTGVSIPRKVRKP